MNTRKLNKLFSFSLVAGVLAAGLATQNAVAADDIGFRWVGGDRGYIYAPHLPRSADSPKSVPDVSPANSGFRWVGGDRGYIYAPNLPRSENSPKSIPDVDPADSGFRWVGGDRGYIYDPDHAG